MVNKAKVEIMIKKKRRVDVRLQFTVNLSLPSNMHYFRQGDKRDAVSVQ